MLALLSPSSVFIILVILAAVLDVLSRRIPNPLNFSILLSGLIASILGWTDVSLLQSVSGIGVSLAILLFPFALNVYRGGDVKLCMGMSAWLGVEGGLWTIGLGIIGGGVLGVLLLLFKRRGKSMSVPMAVCFSMAGLWVERFGVPAW
jgi:Flp pilus assembly protein protease CpaA